MQSPRSHPSRLSGPGDVPQRWAESLDLVFQDHLGLAGWRVIHIDGRGTARLVRPSFGAEDPLVPWGRYEARLSPDELDRLVGVLREHRVWELAKTPEDTMPANPDEPFMELNFASGARSLVRMFPERVYRREPAMLAILKELRRVTAVVVAQAALPNRPAAVDEYAAVPERARGEEPGLRFRDTTEKLERITVTRREFVFPEGMKTPSCHVMKDGYLVVADEKLYVTDRDGKLLVEDNLPQPSVRGPIYWGDDWFGYSCDKFGGEAAHVRLFHANGEEIGRVAIPHLCTSLVSKAGSRVFFLRLGDVDARSLGGPIVADTRTGKILSEHAFTFRGGMAQGYVTPTKDRLLAEERSSDALICFDSDGKVAWRSPFAAWRQPSPCGRYVLAIDRTAGELHVLDDRGESVLRRPEGRWAAPTLLPGDRLFLTCWEDEQAVRQLYQLPKGERLWSVANGPYPIGDLSHSCLSPDGSRLAIFTRYLLPFEEVRDGRRAVFTLSILDLRTGEQLCREELPLVEQVSHVRQPRWLAAESVELVFADDLLYRVDLGETLSDN